MNFKLLLSLIFICLLFKQDEPFEKRKLTESDYKGQVDPNLPNLAFTTCGVYYHIHPETPVPGSGLIHVAINSEVRLLENNCWMKVAEVKRKGEMDELLDHEQGHYDIFLVFNRNFKSVISRRTFDKISYKAEVDSVFKAMFRRYDLLQRKYDIETNNMDDRPEQARWKLYIQKLYSNAKLGIFE